MRVLFVHNQYRRRSGEEESIDKIGALLRLDGHEVALCQDFSARYAGIWGQLAAGFSGLHSVAGMRKVRDAVSQFRPDIVQFQNVYPGFSPSAVVAVSRMGIPTVMRCPNYRLFCPSGLFMDRNGVICERCVSPGREMWCVTKNCEGNLVKSASYAARNFLARIRGAFLNHVDLFIVQSEFQRGKFEEYGVPSAALAVVPGFAARIFGETKLGDEVVYIGRLSREKGIADFLRAAALLPDVPFTVVGGDATPEFGVVPSNVRFAGFVEGEALDAAFLNARIVVIPSKCYEGFPNAVARAMAARRPVIASKLGVLEEVVVNGRTGLTVPSGNPAAIAEAIRYLYPNIELCKAMGVAAADLVSVRYTVEPVRRALISAYERARERRAARRQVSVR